MGRKHRMTVNRTASIGILKDELYRIVSTPDDSECEPTMSSSSPSQGDALYPSNPLAPMVETGWSPITLVGIAMHPQERSELSDSLCRSCR